MIYLPVEHMNCGTENRLASHRARYDTPVMRKCFLAGVWIAWVACGTPFLRAQSDTVDLKTGRPVRGAISPGEANALVVETEEGPRTINGWEIRRIRFDDEPNGLTRARNAWFDENFELTITEIDGLDPKPERPMVIQEAAWLKTMAGAKLSLAGGRIAPDKAILDIREFYAAHPNSYQLDPLLDAWAQLVFQQGNFAEAVRMFERLSTSSYPEIAFRNTLDQGRALLREKKYDEAITALERVKGISDSSDYAVQGKLVADCLLIEARAGKGQADEGIAAAQKIISENDVRNATLFAHAYNALGACYLEKGELKEACRAYLHTELLFPTDSYTHAQALAQLADIWQRLERNDRSIETRQRLKDRYRNSFWSTAAGERP